MQQTSSPTTNNLINSAPKLKPSLNILRLGLCLLAGLISVLAFAPFHIWPLLIFTMAYLVYFKQTSSKTGNFLSGFSFGLGMFGAGCYWIFISLHHYGHASLPLSLLLLFICIIYLATIIGLYTLTLHTLWPGNSAYKLLLVFPASWMLWEVIRSSLFSGFPWLLLGYSQSISPLAGLAPLIGVYGLSAIICYLAGAVVYIINSRKTAHRIAIIISAVVLLAGGFFCGKLNWTQKTKSIAVSLVQGNISQDIKWSPEETQKIIDKYAKLTTEIKHSKIIVWPEAAIPTFPRLLPQFIKALQAYAIIHHRSLLIGAPTYDPKHKNYYNSLLLFGKTRGKYNKQHLVPFGEYYPVPMITNFFLKKLHLPMVGFTAGKWHQPILHAQGISIAAFICYEITFPRLALVLSHNRQLLVTISDDSWFGDSIALAQHLQMGVMQSILLRRDQLFSTNTGITAIIDRFGNIIKKAPENKASIISARVNAYQGKTPIMRYGYAPLIILGGLILMFFLMWRKPFKKTDIKK